MSDDRNATIFRMVTPEHTCPFGVRAKQLLDDHGFAVEDRVLRSREEVDAFEDEMGVETTPQIFIDGELIGGCRELEAWLDDGGGARASL